MPKVLPEERMGHRIGVSMTQAEKERVDRAAAAVGVSASRLCRELTLARLAEMEALPANQASTPAA